MTKEDVERAIFTIRTLRAECDKWSEWARNLLNSRNLNPLDDATTWSDDASRRAIELIVDALTRPSALDNVRAILGVDFYGSFHGSKRNVDGSLCTPTLEGATRKACGGYTVVQPRDKP